MCKKKNSRYIFTKNIRKIYITRHFQNTFIKKIYIKTVTSLFILFTTLENLLYKKVALLVDNKNY